MEKRVNLVFHLIFTCIIFVSSPLFSGGDQEVEANVDVSSSENGYVIDFDSNELENWEHSPEVSIEDNSLRLQDGGFAFREGFGKDYYSFSTLFKMRGNGFLGIHINAGEQGSYVCSLSKDRISLLKEGAGKDIPLSEKEISSQSVSWTKLRIDRSHNTITVELDGKKLIRVKDRNMLRAGGLLLHSEGVDAWFKHFCFSRFQTPVVTDGGVQSSIVNRKVGVADESADERKPGKGGLSWERCGGPPGGLGYDIRYKFDDYDTWYVTDNWAGVFRSRDNGKTWEPANKGIPPQIGFTTDSIPIFCLTVDPHNPNIIWAGTDRTGRIYRSTDGGDSWERRDNGIAGYREITPLNDSGTEEDWRPSLTFRGFTIDPRSSDIVYAMAETTVSEIGGGGIWGQGTGGVVFKTTDGGEHWETIWKGKPTSSLCRYMLINPDNPDVLYVSTGIFDRGAVGEGNPETDPFGGIGILKSTNGGETWEIQNEENGLDMLYLGSLYMHPEDPDTLLVAAGHVMEGGAHKYVEDLYEKGKHSPAGIYRTSDGGENWKQVLHPPKERPNECFTVVEICEYNPDICYAASGDAVYRSNDNGKSWKLVSGGERMWGPPGVVAGFPIDLQIDPRDPDRIFANNYGGGNFLSEDGGKTWQNASKGYTGAQMRQVDVASDNPAVIFSVGRSGLWVSRNAGENWEGLAYDADWFHPYSEYGSVEVDPLNPQHVLAGNSHASILSSSDGGKTWSYQWPPWPEAYEEYGPVIETLEVSDIVFAKADSSYVYAGTAVQGTTLAHEPEDESVGMGVMYSRDNGRTWTLSEDPDIDTAIFSLAVDPENPKRVYAGAEEGLYQSGDGGKTWDLMPGLPHDEKVLAVGIKPDNPDHIIVGISHKWVYLSKDRGKTWRKIQSGLQPNSSFHEIVFDPINPETVYISDAFSGVYRSGNGGESWRCINYDLKNRACTGLSISSDGNQLYVATNGEGVFRLDLDGYTPK